MYANIITVFVVTIIIFLIAQHGLIFSEHFETYYGYYKQHCPTCGWRSRNTCSKCTNCGYCISESGYGECVPGDEKGPYFRSDCKYWEFGDPYYYYPYSNIFPSITINSTYPFHKYGISKPKLPSRKQIKQTPSLNK